MLLNYKSTGEGKPVILIHGLFGSLDNLGLLGKALSSHYRVIQIDLPNHGMSYQPSEFTYQSLADDVLALLDHLGLDETVLIGHSMGGKVSMALAQQHPERVEKLIVLDMAPYDYGVHRHQNVFAGLTASQSQILASRKDAEAILAQHIIEPGVRQFLLKSLYRSETGSYQWRFNIDHLIDQYPKIIGWDVLGTYSGPTLFVKGQQSEYITEDHRTAIAQQFPNAKAHMVSGTGHWLHAEKPETVEKVVTRFLATL
ncbi:alpha/beta fold hydrolase [Parasalinivibrio latis]|uniref:alpha/beta fold hydrolase n=1 Tax=Parasalinivibrio latis TaxID=2952610 RepID=UPI0030E1969C